jgi:uncharacterized protein YndB with AHSA1/START domain
VKKLWWGVLALFGVGIVIIGWRYQQLRAAAALWEGPVPEILSEKLEKNTDTMEVEFTSRVDAPLEVVFRTFTDPERSAEFSPQVRYAKLVRGEGNRKVVEFEMVILGQPQRFTLEFTFIPTEHRVTLTTVESATTDFSGEYRFTASPDGLKTLLTYTGTAKDKVKLPVPLGLQKSAMRETFAATVQALKKGVVARPQAPAQPAASSSS